MGFGAQPPGSYGACTNVPRTGCAAGGSLAGGAQRWIGIWENAVVIGGGEAHFPLQAVVQFGGREVAGADVGGGCGCDTPKSVLQFQE
jgi:hypothetical protein